MSKFQINKQVLQSFENVKKNVDSTDFWSARDLQNILWYSKWENFSKVIEKAKISCKESLQSVWDNFLQITKPAKWWKGSIQNIDDFLLTRYACYLVAQNGDPKKSEIAFAQSYFATQTRKQEISENNLIQIERLNARRKLNKTEKEFSNLTLWKGIDVDSIVKIKSKWDEVLFWWYSTWAMKKKLWVSDNRSLSDFLPDITIKAKDLAMWVTNYNLRSKNFKNKDEVSDEHVKNNKWVRRYLNFSWIVPEELPAEEDIRIIEKKKAEDRRKLKG